MDVRALCLDVKCQGSRDEAGFRPATMNVRPDRTPFTMLHADVIR